MNIPLASLLLQFIIILLMNTEEVMLNNRFPGSRIALNHRFLQFIRFSPEMDSFKVWLVYFFGVCFVQAFN